MKKLKKWLEECIYNDSNQANIKEKAVIYCTERKNRKNKKNIDVLVNYCSDKNLGIIKIYNIVSRYRIDSKKSLFNILSFINTQKERTHIVCNNYYDIFQDDEDLQILEPLITTGKITIHAIKQNFIIDKNNYSAEMIKCINDMFLTQYCYINTLLHNIIDAKNHKKSISKS